MSIYVEIRIDPTGSIIMGSPDEKPKRERKGKSLLIFPVDYTVIDIETTGLSPEYDSIIEISAIKIKDNQVVDSFSSLVRPEEIRIDDENNEYPSDFIINKNSEKIYYVNSFISKLTGITNAMLNDAPLIENILPLFKSFIGNSILVGHNVNFDINFLYDNFMNVLEIPLENDFIDAIRIAKRILIELDHHRLEDIARHYSISNIGSHRALIDCEITNSCFKRLKSEILSKYGTIESFVQSIRTSAKKSSQDINAKNIHASNANFDISHPLYNKRCAFTGALERMTRKDAMQIVANYGGINENNVTAKTNYLILGNNDYCSTIVDGKSAKQKKAELLKLKGNDVEIIPENVFYDMIDQKEI